MQDGDRAHGAAGRQLWTFNRAHNTNIKLLPNWPPNSPDLNPIENVWAHAQAAVDKAGCKTFPDFCTQVDWQLAHLPTSYIESLYASMPKRMEKCVQVKGVKTGY
jgi:hypothetical protein